MSEIELRAWFHANGTMADQFRMSTKAYARAAMFDASGHTSWFILARETLSTARCVHRVLRALLKPPRRLAMGKRHKFTVRRRHGRRHMRARQRTAQSSAQLPSLRSTDTGDEDRLKCLNGDGDALAALDKMRRACVAERAECEREQMLCASLRMWGLCKLDVVGWIVSM